MIYSYVGQTVEQGGWSGIPRFDLMLRRIWPELRSVSRTVDFTQISKLESVPPLTSGDIVITDNHLSTEIPSDIRCVVVAHGCAASHYDRDPHHIVRIIWGKHEPGDAPGGPNVYTRARDAYDAWLEDGVLLRDEQPSFYAYEQTFTVGGQEHRRLGLIAAVELVDFDEGIILPHEQTHSGPKQDRLRLLQTVEANTEQILLLYPDPENRVPTLIRTAIAGRAPDVDAVEIWEKDVQQRLWRLDDPAVLEAIEGALQPLRGLIIADGHHRYSTGLTYRDQQRAAHPDAPPNAAFNFVLATLVSMDDPGLVVLPTHREIHGLPEADPAAILERARAHFTVEPTPDLATTLSRVEAHPEGHAFGFYAPAPTGYWLLTLKPGERPEDLIPGDHSPAWKSLAVSLLHEVLLEQVAQVPRSGIDDKTLIDYHRDPRLAVRRVDEGAANFVFFLSPTRMAQIRAVAGRGEIMPQKSTDFYPKVISGLVMLPVAPDERL